VTSYSISPALQAGLTLNTTTGVISGTPTTAVAATTYTVTASNSAGSTSTTISMAIIDIAPDIAYSETRIDLTSGVPAKRVAVNSGGVATSWTIAPALPAGLSFDTTNGTIEGTPQAASAAVEYTVTAQNSGGSDTVVFTLAVNSGVLLQLGHAESIARIQKSGNRMLTLDLSDVWTLWNAQTAEIIATGKTLCYCDDVVDLKGSIFTVRRQDTPIAPDTIEVRSASDGRLLSSFTASGATELASDGGYVALFGSENLTVLSPTGTVLFTRNGDYSNHRKAFAAPNELRVGGGPAGATTIEKISVPTGASTTVGTFGGTFHSWFLDGERFLTNAGNTVWVYSHAGVQLDLRALPHIENLTGQGDWFWTYRQYSSFAFDVYAVGASATPAASYTFTNATLFPDGDVVGVVSPNLTQFSVVDLSGATPNRTDITPSIDALRSFGVGDDGWMIGNRDGLLVSVPTSGGADRHFSLGRVNAIRASANRIVVAMATGAIIYYNAQTRAEEGRIDYPTSMIELSSDGAVLAVAAPRVIRIISLPSATDIEALTFPLNETVNAISLSGSGHLIGRVVHVGSTYRRDVSTVGSGTLTFSDTRPGTEYGGASVALRLSPSGRVAAPSERLSSASATTNLYWNNTLTGAASGFPAIWVSDDRVLLHRYVWGHGGSTQYSDSAIVDPTGAVLQTVNLTSTGRAQMVDAQRIYAGNKIYSLTTGQVLWSSANEGTVGGVTDSDVVFISNNTVRIEPY
jgi:hypothetical protein